MTTCKRPSARPSYRTEDFKASPASQHAKPTDLPGRTTRLWGLRRTSERVVGKKDFVFQNFNWPVEVARLEVFTDKPRRTGQDQIDLLDQLVLDSPQEMSHQITTQQEPVNIEAFKYQWSVGQVTAPRSCGEQKHFEISGNHYTAASQYGLT